MKRVIINPVTRLSGFLELQVELEAGVVVEARCSSVLFRGFELMLKGRAPLDAIYFTQRICGICSIAHAMAATLALEEALDVIITQQGFALRNLIHGAEILQNHLRHFYFFALPDFVALPKEQCLFAGSNNDLRFPDKINDLLVKHYFQAFDISRDAHQLVALLGGKAPHNHGSFIGGVTVSPTIDKITKFRSILHKIKIFVEEIMLPDVYRVAYYYGDYFYLGCGYGNLLTYGLFDNLYVKPMVIIKGKGHLLDRNLIAEYLNYSWYKDGGAQHPAEAETEPNPDKEQGYSWAKAPRYLDEPCEVGPLARMLLSGESLCGISMMDRTIARVLEAAKIIDIMENLLDFLEPDVAPQEIYRVPDQGQGVGMTDTVRGALGHWLKIDKKLIAHYQVITPSAWNFSPKDGMGQRGVVEQALIGTPVKELENPVELGRIIRSFDPCISCATHLIEGDSIKFTLY